MTQQTINIGSAANDGTGDPLRTAFVKSNDNFTELYARPAGAPSTTLPLIDATPAVIGTSTNYARADHVHPTDATRAPLASPALTGNPTAPTPTAGGNDTSIATTAFVQTVKSGLVGTASSGFDTLGEIENYIAANITPALGNKQPLDADLTALAAISATGSFYYRSAPDTWSAVTVGANLTFAGGTLAASGSGNVSNSGTPALNQLAQWTDATHVKGLPIATHRTDAAFTGTTTTQVLNASDNINVASGKAYTLGGTSVIRAQTSLNNYYFGPCGNLTATGNENTSVGNYALQSLTSGVANVSVGSSALGSVTSGQYNVAVGYGALTLVSDGAQNLGIGASALQQVTHGNENVGIGNQSGFQINTGHYNLGLGSLSNQNLTSGLGNVALGRQAGYVNQSGSYNIHIGYVAGGAAATNYAGSLNIVIGYNNSFANGDGSNRLNIGNLIFGTGVAGGAAPIVGNIGFGTNSWGTGAVGVIAIANGTAPTTSPAGQGQLYVEGGALKFRGSSGTVTVLAPA